MGAYLEELRACIYFIFYVLERSEIQNKQTELAQRMPAVVVHGYPMEPILEAGKLRRRRV